MFIYRNRIYNKTNALGNNVFETSTVSFIVIMLQNKNIQSPDSKHPLQYMSR